MIKLIPGTSSIGEGFSVVNNNANEQIISVTFSSGQIVLGKFNGSNISVALPIPVSGGQVTSPVGTITLGTQSGYYNQVTVSSLDYLYNSNSFNIPTSTVLNLTNGDSTLDRIDAIVIATSTNTITKIDGTPGLTPTLPTISSNNLLVGAIYVKAGATSLTQFYRLIYTTFTSQQQTIYIEDNADYISNFVDLLDVNITGPVDGQVVTYNGTTTKFELSNGVFYQVGSGLTSSGTVFKLGGTLTENATLPLNTNSIIFQGGFHDLVIDANANLKVNNNSTIYNSDDNKLDAIIFGTVSPQIIAGTAGGNQAYHFKNLGLEVVQNGATFSLDFGLTAGSTHSYLQSFQSKDGIIATLADVIAGPTGATGVGAQPINMNEIAFGTGTGLTSSSAVKYSGSNFRVGATNISNTGNLDTIMTGTSNVMTESPFGAIIGGVCNGLTGSGAGVILGSGFSNIDGSSEAAILSSGGATISGSSDGSTILGGAQQFINTGSMNSNITGGSRNVINSSNVSSILGGCKNTICNSSNNSAILGGAQNDIYSPCSSIVGGYSNRIQNGSNRSVILGGNCNLVTDGAYRSSIIGGYNNIVCNSSQQSTILGGAYNTLNNGANRSAILGGSQNIITNGAYRSTILGGNGHTITYFSIDSSVIGGQINTISCNAYSTILGGGQNIINGYGYGNNIIGGASNIITDSVRSAILGGHCNNLISSTSSVIIGAVGLSFSNREQTTITKNLLVTGSMSTNVTGPEVFGFTGTHSVSGHTFTIANGLIISITP